MSGPSFEVPQPVVIDHDRFFKELLQTFFFEFLDLFFPRLSEPLDRASLEFLNQELYVNQLDGDEYRADLLAKVRMCDAAPEAYFLIHIEHQSTAPSNFPRRFFRYFSAILEKHGVLVYPIVIYSHDAPRKKQPSRFELVAPDGSRLLRFQYRTIQLNRLSWRNFLNVQNPVASALMSKMRIAPRDRWRVKLECLRLLVTLKLDPARMRLIGSFVDAYLRLNEDEERRFRQSKQLARLEPDKREAVMEYITSWEERGMQKGFRKGVEEGLQEGRQEGRLATLREVLLDVLTTRFGPVDPATLQRIQTLESCEELRRLTHASLTASSIEDLALGSQANGSTKSLTPS